MVSGFPSINENCKLCNLCIEVCPEGAIILTEKKKEDDFADYKGVLIFSEQNSGLVHPVSYELLGKGRDLADQLDEPLYAVIIGNQVDKGAEELAIRGVDKVYVYSDPKLSDFRTDPYASILENLVREVKPSIFLMGATAIGRSLGPKVAASLETGLTADCTGLDIDSETGLLLQTRPAYGGNIMATITCRYTRPQMATVRYKVMIEANPNPSKKGEIIQMKINFASLPDRIKIVGYESATEEVNITDADIVVSGGKGLGDSSGFRLIESLAKEIGGAVGASRPTVDEGWIEYRHQVGLSGRTVRPKLYLACGISGSVQHMAGMKTSDIIISINKDPDAPIMNISSMGVIGNLYEVIPHLIKKIKEHKKNRVILKKPENKSLNKKKKIT
jgi:electron transfer flavoprotein alpha subunit